MKKSLKVLMPIILVAIIMLLYYLIILNNKYYDSLQDIADEYYPGENAIYLQEGNYSYIIVDSENIASDDFIFKADEGQYIPFKNLFWESFNKKSYFQYKDIISEDFYSFIHVEVHEGYCILLLERYFVNDKKVDVKMYDNFEQLQPIKTYRREYYFKILEMDSIDENYEIRVDIGDNSYYIVGIKEFDLAK